MYLNDQSNEGVFMQQSAAEQRLSALLGLVGGGLASGSGWFEFRLDEAVLDEETLGSLVLAPDGWPIDKSSIPSGYMMHILTSGDGARSTLCGPEGLHIVNALHRDVSKCKRLCNTCLCGVIGRKKVILLAPDEFPADSGWQRRPDLVSHELHPLPQLPEEEAWRRLEEYASRPSVLGGVVTLEPGRFVFVPFGWWHAVRPLDPFTFITGPSQLSHASVQE